MEEWNTPEVTEEAVGLEINSYACAAMADDDNGDNGDNGDDKSDDDSDDDSDDSDDKTDSD